MLLFYFPMNDLCKNARTIYEQVFESDYFSVNVVLHHFPYISVIHVIIVMIHIFRIML